MTIKAIETVYNGYRFRSRLEARHAVFFDTLGIKYDYEPDGFGIDGTWYLPDFKLLDLDCWIEIKGQAPTKDELKKAYTLAQITCKPVFIFYGNIDIPTDSRELWQLAEDPDFQGAIGFVPFGEPFNNEIHYSNRFAWSECDECGKIQIRGVFPYSLLDWCCQSDGSSRLNTPRLTDAYTAARQARFEHGESGR